MENSTVKVPVETFGVTEFEKWLLLILFKLIMGITSMSGNFLVFLTILFSKAKLKTFLFVIIAGHCVNRGIYSTSTTVYAILTLAGQSNLRNIYRFPCHLRYLAQYFCECFASLTLLTLASERFYAVVQPLRYQNLTAKRGWALLGAFTLFTIVTRVLPSYFGKPDYSTPLTCDSELRPIPEFWQPYNSYTNFAVSLLTALIYLCVNVVVRKRIRKVEGSNDNNRLAQVTQASFKVLPKINLLLLQNIIITITLQVLYIVRIYIPPVVANRIGLYSTFFKALDCNADFLISLWASSDLRTEMKSLILRKCYAVGFVKDTSVKLVAQRKDNADQI